MNSYSGKSKIRVFKYCIIVDNILYFIHKMIKSGNFRPLLCVVHRTNLDQNALRQFDIILDGPKLIL